MYIQINALVAAIAAIVAAAASLIAVFHTGQIRIELNHRLDQLLVSRFDLGVVEGKSQRPTDHEHKERPVKLDA